MRPLDLDPGGYRGSYKLVGGRPALDLINTVSWPATGHPHDWLDSIANLQRWLGAVGLPAPPARHNELPLALEIREVATSVLRPLAHGEAPPRSAVERLNDRVAAAAVRRVIDPATLAWRWKKPANVADSLAPVVLDAADLVTAGEHQRLRFCPACGWLFEDQTRNGRRRWCDMADCGSRDKARRYYRRSQQ
ncbi:ABATE domain-containing protein [Luteimonas sp. RD2P54]|uniref:ABATE domain-containing protein n=1 Tax=Luteimonas endophytica TaxID=3042023 RepID=A0ABT6J9W4_9GAMM|nr:ABATE domain-containing protein [Luteimonas endophytica]MDH5823611.1 ABATE domain-containing protein [Luteimonas endophytica]